MTKAVQKAKAEPKQKPANILDLEQRLRETLGTKVQIKCPRCGSIVESTDLNMEDTKDEE